MRCRKVQRDLNAFLDGLVAPEARVAIQEHLRGCPECEAALARLRRLSSLLESIPAAPVPDGFSERLLARAYQHQRQRSGSRIYSWAPMALWRGMSASMRAAAAAMVVIGLAAGALMGRDTGRIIADARLDAGRERPVDPAESYNLDYLTESPRASLAGVYVALATPVDGEER